jgi:hypothetical protein
MGSLAGILTGLLTGGGQPTIDLSQLYNTINNAGQYQRQIINALPPEIQKNLAQYAQSLQGASTTFGQNVAQQGQKFLGDVSSLYGPNSPAAQAQYGAAKQQIYSTVPGTQEAIRNVLAGTGGLQRGNAATALAQPYVQAAQQYGQTAANIGATQTQEQQRAIQSALQTINNMEASVFQQQFGMSREQAAQILQTGNTALQQQLSELINQSVQQTNQTLGLQGVQSTNAYNNALLNQAQNNALIGQGVNLGLTGLTPGVTGPMGGVQGILAGLLGPGGQPTDTNMENLQSLLETNVGGR